MSCKRNYTCDLCGSSIPTYNDGIAIYHSGKHDIRSKFLTSDGCGHHICNNCLTGLRGMFAELDHDAQIRSDLAAEVAQERAQ